MRVAHVPSSDHMGHHSRIITNHIRPTELLESHCNVRNSMPGAKATRFGNPRFRRLEKLRSMLLFGSVLNPAGAIRHSVSTGAACGVYFDRDKLIRFYCILCNGLACSGDAVL